MLSRVQVLSGNTLKIIALAAMTLDHIGMILLPGVYWLRIIGRIAMPVFAFMLAEGCYYTHNKIKYFLQMFITGAVFQLLLFICTGSLYQFILITFSLSLLIIFPLQGFHRAVVAGDKKQMLLWAALTAGAAALALLLCRALPSILPASGFEIDYGFFGVILPALIYFPNFFAVRGSVYFRLLQLTFAAAGILLLVYVYGSTEAFALFSLILLVFYSGERGRLKIKYFFYLYFPIHLGLLYFIGAFLTG